MRLRPGHLVLHHFLHLFLHVDWLASRIDQASRDEDDEVALAVLLDAGADIDATSQLGRTPLIVAAATSHSADVVRLLLSRGANVNARDKLGITPLIAAANADNREAADLLLARGAAPDSWILGGFLMAFLVQWLFDHQTPDTPSRYPMLSTAVTGAACVSLALALEKAMSA